MLYEDCQSAAHEKLQSMCDVLLEFLDNEATNPLEPTKTDVMDVRGHNTYGRMLAALNELCTCLADGSEKDKCFLHCAEPNVADLLYEITMIAHEVFNDQWTFFGNLALDTFDSGRYLAFVIGLGCFVNTAYSLRIIKHKT